LERKVVVAGWGQVVQRKEQESPLLDPLGLMIEASKHAAEDMGGSGSLRNLDGIMVPRVMSVYYEAVAEQLSEKLNALPRLKMVSSIGGNSPQTLVNKAAGMIARGELDRVLIAGGETYYPREKKRSEEENALFKGLRGQYDHEDIIGSAETEMRHGISLPVHGFPLYETALWAESGLELRSYLRRVGHMWSRFSRVAENHPYAWTKTARTAEEIIQPSKANRPVAFPYTKYMTSLITVDLGAAVIMMAEEEAEKYQQKGRRPVHFLAGAYAEDRQPFLIQKTDFTSCLSLKATVNKALNRSGMTIDDLTCFDLYSCFPSSVRIAMKMLGLSESDKRPITLTGGLGFFGGPGNNYSLHAIASLAEAISTGVHENGLITGIGWFMHKHAAGIYSAKPGDTRLSCQAMEDEHDYFEGDDPVKTVDQARGKGIIETYTVLYSRDGSPKCGIVYGKTEEGKRFVAQTPKDQDVFDSLTTRNHVGKPVHVRYSKKLNLNIAELKV